MPPIYRVKNMQKNGIFARHYAKTPQKVGEKSYFFRKDLTTKRRNHHR